jgi:hypothetical protein
LREHVMTQVAKFFVNENVAYGLAIIIVVLAFVFGAWFVAALAPFRSELRRAARRLRQFKTAEDLALSFEEISAEFREARYLGHAWREFEETLVLPGAGRRPVSVIRNSRQAEETFTLDGLLQGKLNLRIFEALPNLFVGSGLLFTFLALASGIRLSIPSLTGAGEQTIDGLHELLGGAFLAFLKSSSALLVSIGLIVLEKRRIHSTEALLADFCAELDARLRLETPDTLAGEQLEELQQQTSELKRFNDGLGGALGDALDTRVTQALAPVLERLIVAVQDLRAERAESNEKFLFELLSDFKRSMSQAAGTELGQMAGAVRGLHEVLESTARTLASGQQQFEAATSRIAQTLDATLNAGRAGLAEQLAQMTSVVDANVRESASRLSRELEAGGQAVSETFGEQTRRVSENVARLEVLTSAWEKLAEQSVAMSMRGEELAGAQERSLEAVRAISREVIDAGASLRQAARHVSQTVSAQLTLTSKVEGVSAEIGRSLATVEGQWKSYEERFAQTDRALASIFEELDRGLARFSEKIVHYVQSVESHLGKAATTLSEAVSTLGSDLEALPEQVQKLGGHVENLRSTLGSGVRS